MDDDDDEIEINEDMVAAGVLAFLDADLRFERPDDVVSEIYRAMSRQRVGIKLAEGDKQTKS